MIHELLPTGEGNTITGKELAEVLGCDIRVVTKQIMTERLAGEPICASMDGNKGFYLASCPDELKRYLGTLGSRIRETARVFRALANTYNRMVEQEQYGDYPFIGLEAAEDIWPEPVAISQRTEAETDASYRENTERTPRELRENSETG